MLCKVGEGTIHVQILFLNNFNLIFLQQVIRFSWNYVYGELISLFILQWKRKPTEMELKKIVDYVKVNSQSYSYVYEFAADLFNLIYSWIN